MMPISPLNVTGSLEKKQDAGFSLLEILVVLSIMGLMMALVTPRLVSTIEATEFSQTANAGAGKVTQIRVEAILRRAQIVIPPTEHGLELKGHVIKTLNLPEGWVVTGDTLYITPSGFCAGGVLDLESPTGRKARYKFDPPECKARRLPRP